MSPIPFGWRAQIVTEPMMDARRLLVFRYSGSGSEIMLNTEPAFQQFDSGAPLPSPAGLLLPTDMWDAIVEAASPAPHGVEIARLEEALKVERDRVDALLVRAGVPSPGMLR